MTAAETTCPACGAQIDAAQAEPLSRIDCSSCGEKVRVQRSFDHFELVETLGIGGMGTVYKARDTQLDRFVALKLLRKELDTEEHAAHLQQEARVTASVDDPNVVQVFSFGRDHNQFYLVMELVDRGSLDDLIEQHQRVPERQVLSAGLQVARGLRAAHEKGLIHRDVKPANILFKDAETAKIGDFGLAGVAEQNAGGSGEIWGTPYYVAPERLQNTPEDFRSDIYSLGATMFHAIAGQPPFEGETNSAAALLDLKSHPLDLAKAAPETSAAVARVVDRMIAPDPSRRFVSYDHLISELEKAANILDGKLPRAPWIKYAIGAGVLILCAAIVLSLWLRPNKQAALPVKVVSPALMQRYEDARKQLLAEKFDASRDAFAALANDTRGVQPLYAWVRLHQGLAALMQNEKTQAKQAFNEVENAGAGAFGQYDNPAAFLDTARKLGASAVVPSGIDLKNEAVERFGLLLYALKDLTQKDIDDASALLERFVATKNPGGSAWINDYKPIAQKYLGDLRPLLEWRKRNANSSSRADLQRAADELKAIETQLKTRGVIGAEVRSEQKRVGDRIASLGKAEASTREQQRQQVIAREKPLLDAAISAYHANVLRYDFVAGLQALRSAQLTEESLRRERDGVAAKAQWLIDWKRMLSDDINRTLFAGAIGDPALGYTGIKRASETELTMRLPYGEAPGRQWTQFPPASLLPVAVSYIKGNPANAADRNWLSAVFAAETNQRAQADTLSGAAVALKPEYRASLPLLQPAK